MEYEFINYKGKLSTYAILTMSLAISILTTGCQLTSPNWTSFPNHPRENRTSYQTSDNDRNYPSSNNGRNYPSY